MNNLKDPRLTNGYKMSSLKSLRLANGVIAPSYKTQLEKFGYTMPEKEAQAADKMRDEIWDLYVNDILTQSRASDAFKRLEKLVKSRARKKEGATV